MTPGSKDVAKAAVRLALSTSREDEKILKTRYAEKGVRVAAVDFGGEVFGISHAHCRMYCRRGKTGKDYR